MMKQQCADDRKLNMREQHVVATFRGYSLNSCSIFLWKDSWKKAMRWLMGSVPYISTRVSVRGIFFDVSPDHIRISHETKAKVKSTESGLWESPLRPRRTISSHRLGVPRTWSFHATRWEEWIVGQHFTPVVSLTVDMNFLFRAKKMTWWTH